jgi:hypothetical protein
MALVKSTHVLHQELEAATRAHADRLEAIDVLLVSGDSAADEFRRDGQEYTSDLARILADTLQMVGGLAVGVGQEDFAMGPGVEYGGQ